MERPVAAASRFSSIGRGMGLGATWGLVLGGSAGLVVLPAAFLAVPLGVVFGTSGGLLSGLFAGTLMVLAEAVRPSVTARYGRLFGALGTPLAMVAVLPIWPALLVHDGGPSPLLWIMLVPGCGFGFALGPFIATGLDEYGRRPSTPDAFRKPSGVPWLKIVLPVAAAVVMALLLRQIVDQIDDEGTAGGRWIAPWSGVSWRTLLAG